jgi:glycosyltransferase involved in cell wall biosynthesis
MIVTAWAALIVVSMLILAEVCVTCAFLTKLLRFRPVALNEASLPSAAVVLSVRGPDPCLEGTLRNLLDQDYPCFTIHVVVDSPEDAALDLIRAVVRENNTDRIAVTFLRQPKTTCSLKCSALVQAVGDLMSERDVIAFIDGDAQPHRSWLRELVAPLSDPAVGVSTGNRWYRPPDAAWGSLVRYYWNAAAVVQVWLNGIVWAGSMAMRSEVIRNTNLPQAWSRALSVDATVYQQIRDHDYGVRFVPGVILVNSESITLTAFIRWVQRQLVAAKSCRPGWIIIAVHAFSLTVSQLLPVAAAAWAAVVGRGGVAALCVAVLVAYWMVSLAAASCLEWAVRRVVSSYGGPRKWLTPAKLGKMFPAMLLTHAAYAYALAKALFRRRVSWRGVEYEIRGRGEVRLISYQPFAHTADAGPDRSVI